MYLIFKFPNGMTARTAEIGRWECQDAIVAELLSLTPYELDGYSPDPLLDYAVAVAGDFGGTLVADTREPEPDVEGRVY